MADPPLRVLHDPEPQAVFAAATQPVAVTLSNATDRDFEGAVDLRLVQTASAIAVPSEIRPWKNLRVLAGQAVLESAPCAFPSVNGETRFLVQWLVDSNRVIGLTEVDVYPTNLLDELRPLFNEHTVGVLDPDNSIKPVLKTHYLEFVNLDERALEDFSGKLVIIGPFKSRDQIRSGLAQTIRPLAARGAAVVCIQPPPAATGPTIEPSFYAVEAGKGGLVVVQNDLVADLARRPLSQAHFIYFCKLALKPKALEWPLYNDAPEP